MVVVRNLRRKGIERENINTCSFLGRKLHSVWDEMRHTIQLVEFKTDTNLSL